MQIFLNGELRDCDNATTLVGLLESAGYAGRRVAVEINRDIVPRSHYATTSLKPGDKVEIVHAIGGG